MDRYLFMNLCARIRFGAGCVLSSGLFGFALLSSTPVTAAEISVPLRVPLAHFYDCFGNMSWRLIWMITWCAGSFD